MLSEATPERGAMAEEEGTQPSEESPETAAEGEGGAGGGTPEPPSEEFVSAGEGTMSDGKGGSKKIFFLQQKKEQPRWLKTMSEGISSVGAAANDTVSRLVKGGEKSEEKEVEKMEGEDKPEESESEPAKDRVKAIVDAGRHSLDAASTRLSGLMASMKPAAKDEDAGDEAPAPAPSASSDASMTSRLAALRIAMSHLAGKEDAKPDQVAQLKAEIAELKETVATLVEKVAKLEASGPSS